MSGEKRSAARKKLGVPVDLRILDEDSRKTTSYAAVTSDISDTGLSFESKDLLSLNTALEALIHLPGQKKPITARLVIVRVESDLTARRYRIGAEFKQIAEKDRHLLSEMIGKIDLRSLLEEMLKLEASDMHLTVGHPPIMRVNGDLIPMASGVIEDGQVQAMFYPLMNEPRRVAFEKDMEADFAFSLSEKERFRVNLHWQKERMEAAVRNVSSMFRNFDELRLPSTALERMCHERAGLVLITGRAGSGKTTTLAAMIEYINANLSKVIVTIEDPIEFVFTNKKSVIKQREVGRDTVSYASALKASLRQNPDVVVVSELLDEESIHTAIAAAETGHLVIATVHAGNTVQALEKIIGSFPADHAMGVAKRLASCLRGVLFQVLLPGTEGSPVMATELLLNTPAISNHIAMGNLNQITGMIETGQSLGMHSLSVSLQDLVSQGVLPRGINPYLY